jgi:hypothetical protein
VDRLSCVRAFTRLFDALAVPDNGVAPEEGEAYPVLIEVRFLRRNASVTGLFGSSVMTRDVPKRIVRYARICHVRIHIRILTKNQSILAGTYTHTLSAYMWYTRIYTYIGPQYTLPAHP